MNVNVNLLEQNVIEITGGIAINADVKVESILYVKNDMFGT